MSQNKECNELIGEIAAAFLKKQIAIVEGQQTFRFDGLEDETLTACVNAIWNDPRLRESVFFKIPRDLLKAEDAASPGIIFEGTAAEARNLTIPEDKRVLLTANSNDGSNSDTLKDVAQINRETLLTDAGEWLKRGGLSYTKSDPRFKKLSAVFTAFMREWNPTLVQAAAFLLSIVSKIEDEGEPPEKALDDSLKTLVVPHNETDIKKRFAKEGSRIRDWEPFFNSARSQSRWFSNPRPSELTSDVLRQHLETMEDIEIPDEALSAYLDACDLSDDQPLTDLLRFDWDSDYLKAFIEGSKKKVTKTLAQLTLKCFENHAFDELDSDFNGRTVREFLEKELNNLVRSRAEDLDLSEAVEFLKVFSRVLQQDDNHVSLLKKWDEFLHPNKIVCSNIISGILIGARRLLSYTKREEGKTSRLLIQLISRQSEFLETVNPRIILYFSLAYREFFKNLEDSGALRWKTPKFSVPEGLNPIFNFARVKEETLYKDISHKSKSSRTYHKGSILKFELSIDGNDRSGKNDSVKIEWHFPIKSLAYALPEDIGFRNGRGRNSPLPCLKTYFAHNCRDSNSRGILEEPTLRSLPSFSLPSGRLIRKTSAAYLDIDAEIRKHEALYEKKEPGSMKGFMEAWDAFKESYEAVAAALCDNKSVSDASEQAYLAYKSLLTSLDDLPASKTARKIFNSLVISVGVFSFVDRKGNSYAIVPPWHPLRLKSLLDIQKLQSSFLRRLLEWKDSNLIQEEDFFFQRVTRDETALLDPQVVSIPEKLFTPGTEFSQEYSCGNLLIPREDLMGYTLYGPANAKLSEITERGPIDPAAELFSAMENYVKLSPEESRNLSICLPDVSGPALPIEITEKISAFQAKDTDRKWGNFTLSFGSVSRRKNSDLIESLTTGLDENPEVKGLRVTSNGIFSPLRLFVPPDSKDSLYARPYSISLITHLGSKSASLTWVKRNRADDTVEDNTDSQYLQHKNVNLEDEESSELILVPPKQSAAGIELLRAVASLSADDALLTSSDIESGEYYLAPALRAAFAGDIKDRIQKIHRDSDWVVICDSLIDRKMLEANGIEIIRYKKDDKSAGTVIISSTESPASSKRKLIQTLDRIPEFGQISRIPNEAERLADMLLKRSYQISGYVALRAASQLVSAGELLGLCLSDQINTEEIFRLSRENGESVIFATTCLLDDYANWFRNVKKRADLLTVVVTEKDGETTPRVHLCVSEAKFCSLSSLNAEKKNSAAQIMATISVFMEGLTQIGDQTNYDSDIWLERLSNLIIELSSKRHQSGRDVKSDDIRKIAKRILDGDIQLTLHGYSHVFVHDWAAAMFGGTRDRLGNETQDACPVYQEIYNQGQIVELLKTFLDPSSDKTRQIRDELFGHSLRNDFFTPVSAPSFLSDLKADMRVMGSEKKELESVIKGEASVLPDPGSSAEDHPISAPVKAESIIQESENAAVTEETPSAPAEPYAAHPDAISETSETPMSEIRFAPSFAQALEKEAKDTVLSEDRKQWAEKAGKRLCGILQAKGIPTAFLGADPTPNGCLVRLKGDFKLKTKVIDDLREGLLSTESLNVAYSEAVPGEFHVFLASPERESVPMWNIWKSRKMERQGGINFDVAIGLREDDGRILYLNPLDKEPHTLIAGESGSGKSILVKMMLLDLAATNSSKLTRFYLIDPKEFLDYKPLLRLPHFGHDLALSKDQASAVKVLEYVNAEMERRKTVISNADCENIAQFNSQARKEERLPVLWVIHDELPSWTADKAYNLNSRSVSCIF